MILDSNLHKLNASKEFYKNLQPLRRLTELTSREGFSSDTATRAVLRNCPNLLVLECFNGKDLPNHLDFIADHNRKLESLEIFTIRATDAKFQFLEKVRLNEVENAHHLVAFLKANPTIETLLIRNLEEGRLIGPSLNALINETSLKFVEMEGELKAIHDVHYTIICGYGTWKTLVLTVDDYTRQCLEYNFPENPEDWGPFSDINNWEGRYFC